MRTLGILWTVLACGPLQNLAAQERLVYQRFTDLPAGERIRVTAPGCGLFRAGGDFRGLMGDSIHLTRNEVDLTCPLASVERLEIRQAGRNWGNGTAKGAALGGLGGAVVGGLFGSSGIVLGAVVGLPFGAAMGTGSYARRAALTGLCVGGLGGAALGALLGSSDDYWGPGFWAVVFGVSGAPVGALGGSAVGLLSGNERWVVVESPGLRPRISATPDGRMGIGLTIPMGR
ncbi:MAG: hypothetical protein PVJ76_20065 [Gemmatimonadota bacterium]|jgi:hypothetical protein